MLIACFVIVVMLFIVLFLINRFLLLKSVPKMTSGLAPIHVVITGASKGIGRALAEIAIRAGAHVSLIARDKKALLETKHHLEQLMIKYIIQSFYALGSSET